MIKQHVVNIKKQWQDVNIVLSDRIARKEELGCGYESKYLNECVYTYEQ